MKNIKDKSFLITGGTGSFGQTMLNYLIDKDAGEVRIFSRDEKKQEELRHKIDNKKVKFYIGDVRDQSSIDRSFKGVDYVFHAAALKQVPSCEFFPLEAIKTNILGTENVIRSSINHNIKTTVLLSTDKAVYPVNAMGMSKALAEKLIISNFSNVKDEKTKLCITRYGNVMGSRGSVIPLFIDQIRNNKDLTVTDNKMTRFLMSLDESTDLVLKAFTDGNQGDIFVRKSPSAKMEDLAKALIEIFNSSSKIIEIGTRHGEKLYETLLSREEILRAKELKDYYCIKADYRSLNYDNYFIKGTNNLSNTDDYNSHNTNILSVSEIKTALLNMEFVKRELL